MAAEELAAYEKRELEVMEERVHDHMKEMWKPDTDHYVERAKSEEEAEGLLKRALPDEFSEAKFSTGFSFAPAVMYNAGPKANIREMTDTILVIMKRAMAEHEESTGRMVNGVLYWIRSDPEKRSATFNFYWRYRYD